eukprot:9208310-Pyramimonas_sp.AAC.1
MHGDESDDHDGKPRVWTNSAQSPFSCTGANRAPNAGLANALSPSKLPAGQGLPSCLSRLRIPLMHCSKHQATNCIAGNSVHQPPQPHRHFSDVLIRTTTCLLPVNKLYTRMFRSVSTCPGAMLLVYRTPSR